jgi:membrane protein YdbS with pleckstrin-like domain
MITQRSGWAVTSHSRHSCRSRNSSNKLLKVALWMVWLPIVAVLWVMLLDTSYDWISSPSNTKVISGVLILMLMACVVVALLVKGARKLWTR